MKEAKSSKLSPEKTDCELGCKFGWRSMSERLLRASRVPLIILAWYASNILVLLLNKYLLAYFGFRYPVFLTMCHMIACTLLAKGASQAKVFALAPIQSPKQLSKIVLLAAIFCLSLTFGNSSLRYLPVSFTQAVGATTPFFTAFLSLVLLGSRETSITYASLVPVVVGIAVATRAEPSFHLLGFCLAVAATCARAFKSVLQGVLLEDGEKLDSLSLLYWMSSISCCMLLPAALLMEREAFHAVPTLAKQHAWFVPMLALNSALAFFVNLTNFLVTKTTSALTLQVLGNAKGVVAAFVSVALFKNPVTYVGCAGYLLTVAGVVGYSQAKRAAKEQVRLERREAKLSLDTERPSGHGSPLARIIAINSQAGASPRISSPRTSLLRNNAEQAGSGGFRNFEHAGSGGV